MTLKDLIITKQQISEALVENVLKGRVELIQDGNEILLTKESINFPNKIKILLFLAGGKAWELLDSISLSFSPGEIGVKLSIPGNSLRPLLRELSNSFLVGNDKGRYQITPKGVYELERMLKTTTEINKTVQGKRSKAVRVSRAPKSKSGTPLKSKSIEVLIDEGYFSIPRNNQEILMELGRRGVTIKSTSLPSFLLPLIRKKILVRDYKEKNKRKVWAYKAIR